MKLFISALLIIGISASSTFSATNIILRLGQQKTISIPVGSEVHVGDPSVVSVRTLSSRGSVIITGKRKGATSITIASSSSVQEKTIEVLNRNPNKILSEIRDAFGEIEGVYFQVIGNVLAAKGTLVSLSDKKILDQVFTIYPSIIDLVDDMTEKRMVSISVKILEVTRSKNKSFNKPGAPDMSLSYNRSSRPLNPFDLFGEPTWSIAVTADQLAERLGLWIENGNMEIVANPTLSVTEGDSARFLSGGEIPYTVVDSDGKSSVIFKSYGVELNILPVVLNSGSIKLNVESELSSVDYTKMSGGYPGILKRKTTSIGIVKPGETLALSGIFMKKQGTNKRRVPVIGYILPFLFLKSEKEFEQKEVVMLITPNAPSNLSINDYPAVRSMDTSKN